MELLGTPLETLLPRAPHLSSLWQRVEDAVFAQRTFENESVSMEWAQEEAQALRWSGRCIPAESSRGALTMLIVERPAASA